MPHFNFMATEYLDGHINTSNISVRIATINNASPNNKFPWLIFECDLDYNKNNIYRLRNSPDTVVVDAESYFLIYCAGASDENQIGYGFLDTNTYYNFLYSYDTTTSDNKYNLQVIDTEGEKRRIGNETWNIALGAGYDKFWAISWYGIALHFKNDYYGSCGVYYIVKSDFETMPKLPSASTKSLIHWNTVDINISTQKIAACMETHDDVVAATKIIGGASPQDTPTDPNPGGGDSKPGGGGGDGDIGGDTNPDDGLPTISALDSGLLTAYNPTVGHLQSLGQFLWSDSFNLDTFKKLFNDPFDTLLGLSVVPVKPNTSGTKSIMFGNMDSGVSAPVVSNQWVSKDMGSVTLNEVWKGALDYAPSTSVTIYLPFIGMRQLNVNDVMGSSLHLIYKFDVLTGSCIAQIYVNHSSQGNKNDGFSWTKNQGLLYEFIGQCAENIPLASQDFTNTIRAAIGGVAVATGAAASIATGNPALGVASLTVGAANLGMQASTPTVERGGHLSGSASILGYSQPFLIVERPHQCKPSKYYALRGVPSQVYTSKLSKCTNFTQITANNNLHIAGATDTELTELQNLLVAGVYFPNNKR